MVSSWYSRGCLYGTSPETDRRTSLTPSTDFSGRSQRHKILVDMTGNEAEAKGPGTVKALEKLRLFNEKASRLDGLSFTSGVIANPISYRLETNNSLGRAWREGPSQETTDAFVNTLRYFVDDKEVSFKTMAKIYTELGEAWLLPEDLVAEFNRVRDAINVFLDQRIPVT